MRQAIFERAEGLEVETAQGWTAFRDLEADWRSLHREVATGAPPFLSLEWAESWHRHLAKERRPRILCVRQGRRLVALLSLCEEQLTIPGVGASIRRLSFAGERFGGADYLDVLACPELRGPATAAIFDHLAAAGDFDLLELDGIDRDSPSHGAIRESFSDRSRFKQRLKPRYVCPQVALDGGFEKVLARSSRASNFKRRLRQLRALPGFEFRTVRAPAEAAAAYERFLQLHDERWSAQGGSDALSRPAAREFHREVVRRLAEAGRVQFDELWVEGACVASIYGMDEVDGGDTYYFFQSGYDPKWASKSVGLVTLGLSIEAAIGRGARIYDFLHGMEPYKLEWAGGRRETVSVRVACLGFGATAWMMREAGEELARKAAHALLPAGVVELLRRRRRAREQGA